LTNFHENYVIARQPMAYFQISDKNMADEWMCGWGRHWRTPLYGKMHVVLGD
jgi:hypothetical protein